MIFNKPSYSNPYKISHDSNSIYLKEEIAEELLELFIYNILSERKQYSIIQLSNNYMRELIENRTTELSRREIINALKGEYFHFPKLNIYFLGKHLISILNHYNIYSLIKMYYTPEIILCRDKFEAESIVFNAQSHIHPQTLKLTPEFDLDVIDILNE